MPIAITCGARQVRATNHWLFNCNNSDSGVPQACSIQIYKLKTVVIC